MKILLVTDAWRPQVNGVVRTLEEVTQRISRAGHDVRLVTPDQFLNLPMPTYPEIRLSLATSRRLGQLIDAYGPDQVHIATEGPLGQAARKACLRRSMPFTTSYHTRFPEYVRARLPIPLTWPYAWMRKFHNAGNGCLVSTESVSNDLKSRGFTKIVSWSRGVDHHLFRPLPADTLADERGWTRPIFLSVGRLSVEKNIPVFLDLELPGTKVVVGDGPLRSNLERKYPDVVFTGVRTGEDLVRHYAAADVFVFPSRTDTFGNVMLEAMACGVPVAAFPVSGPVDVIGCSGAGVIDEDLRKASLAALEIPREVPRAHALRHNWEDCVRVFLETARVTSDGRAVMPGWI